jgi:predicted nucleotidyltransferase
MVNQIKKYFSQLPCKFVILFGSYADGSYNIMSDVDIGIYSDEMDLKTLGFHTAMLESLLEKKVDLTILNGIENKNPQFGFNILNNHQVLLLNDKSFYINFKTKLQLSYLDHKPLLQMNQKALINRIKEDKIGRRDFA